MRGKSIFGKKSAWTKESLGSGQEIIDMITDMGGMNMLTHLTWSGYQSLFLCSLMEVASRKIREGSVLYLIKYKYCLSPHRA